MAELFVITGPTATGKTALGVEMAKLVDGEVVSADSMQIYRGMDIGTAKPTPAETDGVAHHMLDIADPRESFSTARYAAMADACVQDILARGRTPIVVGGTGLYIDGLIRGTDYAAAPSDPDARRAIEAQYDAMGGEAFRWPAGTFVNNEKYKCIMMAMKTTLDATGCHFEVPTGTADEVASLDASYEHLCKMRDELVTLNIVPPVSEWSKINPNL